MKRWKVLIAAGVAGSAAACASLLGIEDGVLDNGEAGADGGKQVCVADGGDHPDTASGLFVYGDVGTDSSNCGGEASPCKTIQYGVDRAKGISGKTTVFVAIGQAAYHETVKLAPNLTIEGGWTVIGAGNNAEWDRVCSLSDGSQLATIVGTEVAAVRADDLGGEATLRYLAIQAKDAGPSESIYGVFASGSSTKLTLDNVVVEIGLGGAGQAGVDGDPGATGGKSCPPGDGLTPPNAEAGVSAQLGTFGPDGVSSMTATNGGNGRSGGNGLRGTDGGCVTGCLTCALGAGPCASAPASCGGVGKSGCGGGGGGGGTAGGTGGSAIGIYAWGGAVVVTGGKIEVAGGGNGGSGGQGAPGGEGGPGEIGDAATACSTSCANVGVACTGTSTSSAAGTPGTGTRGANGSNGAGGGGGAGGFAYGIVSGLDASVIVDASVTVKSGGTGGAPGGASGLSAERFP